MTIETATRVDVVGGVSVETVLTVDHVPDRGEVVAAVPAAPGLGGRGANQAVAVARSGVEVRLVASIGDDLDGRQILAELAGFGVSTELVAVHPEARTGHSYRVVAPDGPRTVVVPEANALTDVEAVRDVADRLATAAVVLLQGQVGPAVIEETIRLARDWPGRLVYNPAPVVPIDPALYAEVAVLVVNEDEAAALCGVPVTHDVGDIEDLAVELASRGRSVVVSMGAEGAVVVPSRRPVEVVMAAQTHVVDAAGAGDAFVGVLAAGLAVGMGVQEATAVAVRQATRTVARRGAVRSYPTFEFD
ncbi:ribokinase [Raineyella fluvialis]|uniref:Ribokinase n=1 Tax=Raineyella fluvialis TaxID=2662261 RepID=A0A5Q2FDN5_9ACTN|nr:ribokinase [Raineyella fluvialis]QGF22396.1 ribokinase [Raineyella fluvialis]